MKKYFLFLLILTATIQLSAQEFNSRKSESSMKITGTSTLHDWDIDVTSFTAKVVLEGETIKKADFSAEVKSFKSGISSMDRNTYNALNADKYPRIRFTGKNIKGTIGKISIRGNLTIAGVTKPIVFPGTMERWAEQSMTIKGEYTFKMSEFGVDPPTAMLSTIRTGDEITINFKIVLYQ